jgi:hypothetical protein
MSSKSVNKEAQQAAAHDAAVKAANDVLQQREPVSAAVLAWGWLLKQVRSGALDGPHARARVSARGSFRGRERAPIPAQPRPLTSVSLPLPAPAPARPRAPSARSRRARAA